MSEATVPSTLNQRRYEMAAILGLDEPVPEAVLVAAIHDSTYARNLLASRGAPTFLNYLLANPPTIERPSAATLALRATAAVGRWAKTGFSVIDEAGYARRLDACAACPHHRAPAGLLAKAATAGVRQQGVCGLCGCSVARKARLASERCPGVDPDNERLSRWGEPRYQEAAA